MINTDSTMKWAFPILMPKLKKIPFSGMLPYRHNLLLYTHLLVDELNYMRTYKWSFEVMI
jgi:hypothetical protein